MPSQFRIGALSTLVIVGMLVLVTSASAQEVIDTFSTDTITAGYWDVSTDGTGPYVAQHKGTLEVYFPTECTGQGYRAGYLSDWSLRGNFDIQVDYSLPLWPATNGLRAGLEMMCADGVNFNIHRVSLGQSEQKDWPRESYTMDFGNGTMFRTGTNDLTGTLRVTRVGSMFTGHHRVGRAGQWVEEGSVSRSKADTQIRIKTWSEDGSFAGKPGDVTFSNFRVNSGQLVFSEPAPSLTLSTASAVGGSPMSGKVTLATPAPPDGVTVSLTTTNPAIACPASVAVPAGTTHVSFDIATRPVSNTQYGHVSATFASVTYNEYVTVLPGR